MEIFINYYILYGIKELFKVFLYGIKELFKDAVFFIYLLVECIFLKFWC